MKAIKLMLSAALIYTLLAAALFVCAVAVNVPSAYGAEPVHVDVPLETSTERRTVDGHPLTSVVVTQCNLIVAVYMTMKDGRLVRFDKTANVPSSELMEMAYTADRSERVEVSCNETGAVGYEKRDPI